jgi:hypothetical protein
MSYKKYIVYKKYILGKVVFSISFPSILLHFLFVKMIRFIFLLPKYIINDIVFYIMCYKISWILIFLNSKELAFL